MQWHAITSTFSHCVSPPECSHAETAHRLKPISRDKQLWFRKRQDSICASPPKVLSTECLSSVLLILKMLSECPPCRFHLTSLQQTTNTASLLYLNAHIRAHWNIIINKEQGPVMVPHKTLYTNLSSVLLYESSLPACCLSGCPCRLRLCCCCWWHCPYSQTSCADKAQWGQLPLGFWGGGWTLPHSQIEKSDPDWLRKAVRLLRFLHVLFCCRLKLKVVKVFFLPLAFTKYPIKWSNNIL